MYRVGFYMVRYVCLYFSEMRRLNCSLLYQGLRAGRALEESTCSFQIRWI
jgi:hypothetical protein